MSSFVCDDELIIDGEIHNDDIRDECETPRKKVKYEFCPGAPCKWRTTDEAFVERQMVEQQMVEQQMVELPIVSSAIPLSPEKVIPLSPKRKVVVKRKRIRFSMDIGDGHRLSFNIFDIRK